MHEKQRIHIYGFLIFLFAFLFLMGLEWLMQPYASDGIYFQGWSSEKLMQTVSIEDLRQAPLETLFYIHIQPPGFDTLRAILVAMWPSLDIRAALRHVDASLYYLWAILFGLMGTLLFVWFSELIGLKAAIVASVLFLLHTASIFYATLLESTFLSSLLILYMYYLLWRIKRGHRVSMALFSIVILALFFFRSIFQLPALFVFTVSLILLKVPARKLLIFILVTGGISGLYILKQYYLFRLISTSSFSGLNLINSIGLKREHYPVYLEDPANLKILDNHLPNTLTRLYKINGEPNFNNINYLNLDRELVNNYLDKIRRMSVWDLSRSYLENARVYFMPSSSYSENVIVDRLPWRPVYDIVFSYPTLLILFLLAGTLSIRKTLQDQNYATSAALILPGLYIFLVSILFDRGENMRFKFFLEPVLFIFLAAQFYRAVQQFQQTVFRKGPTHPPSTGLE